MSAMKYGTASNIWAGPTTPTQFSLPSRLTGIEEDASGEGKSSDPGHECLSGLVSKQHAWGNEAGLHQEQSYAVSPWSSGCGSLAYPSMDNETSPFRFDSDGSIKITDPWSPWVMSSSSTVWSTQQATSWTLSKAQTDQKNTQGTNHDSLWMRRLLQRGEARQNSECSSELSILSNSIGSKLQDGQNIKESTPRALRGCGFSRSLDSGNQSADLTERNFIFPANAEFQIDCNTTCGNRNVLLNELHSAPPCQTTNNRTTVRAVGDSARSSKRQASSTFWPDNNGSRANGVVVSKKGNIFLPRADFYTFQQLPADKQNTYFIHMDDDSCTGNEDTRTFLLAQLTSHRVSRVPCIACHESLIIYDHFPVIDGTFFLTPVPQGSDSAIRVVWHSHGISTQRGNQSNEDANDNEITRLLLRSAKPVLPPPGCLGPRQQVSAAEQNPNTRSNYSARQERYLYAICMSCMGLTDSCKTSIQCRSCQQPWQGSTLIVGGLYTYDIFAASPCCADRLTCKFCGTILDGTTIAGHQSTSQDNKLQLPLPFYSQYSRLICCPFCSRPDYHFVKPFEKHYQVLTYS